MAKKLTMDQLGELGIHNAWAFCHSFWFVDHTAHTRQTMGSSGWYLHCPGKRNPVPERFRNANAFRLDFYKSGRTKPEDLEEIRPTLESLGFPHPSRWIRFMGVWMDADLYDRRMAELVEQHKAKDKTPA